MKNTEKDDFCQVNQLTKLTNAIFERILNFYYFSFHYFIIKQSYESNQTSYQL
jgi:hypothetical protein